ncbi:DinB family protein [Gangjinia marincola]|uniref:DinB family protein n=1 Tax=Gangjinia marincola TaxID=578463 RepID=A0ABP3XVD1_9FLAO
MKTYFNLFILFSFIASSHFTYSQYEIVPPKGYDLQIGNMVSMLENLKGRVTQSVATISQKETDFLLDQDANRIGAMIYHLAATEKVYQLITFENRQFNKEEEKTWGVALSLGENAREQFKDQPISYYLSIWDEVRAETLRLLKEKDDKWFSKKAKGAGGMTNHWAWFHVMEHQANHMGQIRLIQKRVK